jgi:hypothetical protein
MSVVALWVVTCNLVDGINVSEERIAPIFRAEDGGSMFLRNVGNHLQDYTSQPTRPQFILRDVFCLIHFKMFKYKYFGQCGRYFTKEFSTCCRVQLGKVFCATCVRVRNIVSRCVIKTVTPKLNVYF